MRSNIEIGTQKPEGIYTAGVEGVYWVKVPYGHYFSTTSGVVYGKAPQDEIDQAEVKAKLGAGPVVLPLYSQVSMVNVLKNIYDKPLNVATSKLTPLSSQVSTPHQGTVEPPPPETCEPEEA